MREIRTWTTKDSAALYNIAGWSSGYFRINDAGHVEVTPSGPEGLSVDLFDLTLDLQRRVMETPEGDVALTTREFVMLEFLVRRDGEACSREQIRENVWGSSFDPGTNVVDVCIARLRQKLGDTTRQPRFIKTVWGTGYKFADQ